MNFKTEIPLVEPLVEEVLARCTNPDSEVHGPHHWRHVAETALRIYSEHPDAEDADPTVLFLFALFHDCNRLNDHTDPNHGSRGGVLATNMWNTEMRKSNTSDRLFVITGPQMRKLFDACEGHTDGELSDDATIAVCWDADRLNLARVGNYPSQEFLSLEHDERFIHQESERVWDEPMTWEELHHEFSVIAA